MTTSLMMLGCATSARERCLARLQEPPGTQLIRPVTVRIAPQPANYSPLYSRTSVCNLNASRTISGLHDSGLVFTGALITLPANELGKLWQELCGRTSCSMTVFRGSTNPLTPQSRKTYPRRAQSRTKWKTVGQSLATRNRTHFQRSGPRHLMTAGSVRQHSSLSCRSRLVQRGGGLPTVCQG
jgi:hypothetical protein